VTSTATAAGTVAAAPTTATAPAPGPAARAGDAAVSGLLNCFLRESSAEVGDDGRLRLQRLGLELLAPLAYRSASGHHAWRPPVRLLGAPEPVPLDHVVLAALLGKELAAGTGDDHGMLLGELVAEVAASAANVATFLAAPPAGAATPFIAAEQSLAFGHPLHPAPKSRQPMDPDDVRRYSPELCVAFPLHWFRADRSIVAEDSALEGATATELLAALLGEPAGDRTALLVALRHI
jgi:siderophore synthetase component